MLAAGDTFRAAAIEQLKIWGERTGATVVAGEQGADAAGLAFDALTGGEATGADVLLIDTAGRLQNKDALMAELEKIIRVIRKLDPTAPHSVLLTLDATTGQNAVNQVEIFGRRAGVTGLVMTKLDGTARGGILVAIAAQIRPAGAFHRRRRRRRRPRAVRRRRFRQGAGRALVSAMPTEARHLPTFRANEERLALLVEIGKELSARFPGKVAAERNHGRTSARLVA